MEKIVIEGGNRLEGEVIISGAKNSVLPLMASTILTSGVNSFTNVPDLHDVRTMSKLLVMLGAKVEYDSGNLEIDSTAINNWIAPYELVRTMRASVLVLGPLTARFGKTKVSFPGGCAIGERPIDQHLKGLDENMMLASALAQGETILLNAACEPEVVDLANALNKMGANISGAGTDIITIKGVSKLKPIKNYEVMPDRIESGTLMVAAVLLSGDLLLKNCIFEHSGAVIGKLIEVGAEISKVSDGVRVKGTDKFKSIDFTTLPYPGFPTDMQAQLMTLMSVSRGLSIISETIFPQRYLHAGELRRMGAEIKLVGNSAVVRGVKHLSGAPIMASDLRASASLVLAGLIANGRTDISRVYHLDRGYDRLDNKLEQVGAKIWRDKE